jgi:hypothetical protein
MSLLLRGYCAGISVFERVVQEPELGEMLNTIKQELASGELKIKFAGELQNATEVCVDVYRVVYDYQQHLSTAFKR